MNVLVISGFLGAGKTTFIRELASRTGRQVMVYENECGQADIDSMILETDEIRVWESLENCICCSGKQDFASSVLTIANTIDPDILVVEPTGIAKLSSVLENVGMVSYERIQVLPSIAIVGADTWSRQHRRYPEIFLDQMMSADTVVISKTDLAGPGDTAAVSGWVRERNPHAQVADTPYRALPDAWFSSLLEQAPAAPGGLIGRAGAPAAANGPIGGEGAPAAAGVPAAAPSPQVFTLTVRDLELPTPTHLFWLLDALVSGVFGDVDRAKGVLRCGREWVRFDVVDRSWAVTGAEAPKEGSGKAVFIGSSLRRAWLHEAFPAGRADIAAGKRRLR